ncbi:MAG: TonB-dependent receptor [Muribaculaceae bacterium]|nr:TonB-dependent receptor [Muribaculaceae bacterium]
MSAFCRALAALMAIAMPLLAHAFRLSGKVLDSDGEPQSYASYHIYLQSDTAKVVTAGTAGVDGEIETNLSLPGKYLIKVSFVGATDKTVPFSAASSSENVNLGDIVMSSAENTLGELEVTAQKPLVSKEIDRVGYDVQSDAEAPTSTLSEMLRKVPMVSVDSDGTITVNGGSNFQVYKNGRPSKSYSNNAAEIFKAIPASMIKRIEVITEPGAKYDAEGVGAILNIVTLDDLSVRGVMGTAGIDIKDQNLIPAPNIWLSSQIDKVTFSLYGGYRNFNHKERDNENWTDYFYNNGNSTHSRNRSKNRGNMSYFGAEASYELDSLNLFTAELNGYWYAFDSESAGTNSMLAADGSTIYSYNTTTRVPSTSYLDIDANFNYQHLMRNPGEMLNVSYQVSTNKNKSESNTLYHDFINSPVDYSGVEARTNLKFIEHTFQFDWTKPFAKVHSVDLGAKAIIRRNHSIDYYDYIGSHVNDDDFSHITDVAALYAQYSAKLGRFGLRAGLRYEYSHLKASYADERAGYSSNLNDVVPSAALSWQVNDANSLAFNYAARINRPGIDFLNPAVNESPNSLSFGNPDLNSAMHHSMKLTYMYIAMKFNCNLAVNYETSNNGIAAVNYLEDNRMVHTYRNIGQRRELSFTGFAQWTITRAISVMANVGMSYIRFAQSGLELSRWNPFFYAQYSHRLPWKLNAQLGAFMFTSQPNDVYSYNDTGRFSNSFIWRLSLGRSFLKEDRLNVRIEATNPIGRNTRRWTSNTVNGDYTGTSVSTMNHLKSIRLAISYRFGSMNAQVKKTARSITNDDMVGGSSAAGASGGNGGGGGM